MDDWYTEYIEACKQAVSDEKVFAQFKQHRDYQYVLEHLSQTQGSQYASEIGLMCAEHKAQINWNQLMRNDTLGKPTTFIYHVPGAGKMRISPTTLRYVCLGMKALSHMRKCQMRTVHMVEVGGGYGGQCYMMHRLAAAYNIQIQSYTIFDLPEVSALQQKYLTNLLGDEIHHVRFFNPWQKHIRLEEPGFLFSSYALGELSVKNQELYHTIFTGHIEHGYVIWNSDHAPTQNFYKVTNGEDRVQVIEERPKTFHWNKVYLF